MSTPDYSGWVRDMMNQTPAIAPSEYDVPGPEADPGAPAFDDAAGPLSEMMRDNAPLIEVALNAYGVENVAAFFINFGTGLATTYGVADIPNVTTAE